MNFLIATTATQLLRTNSEERKLSPVLARRMPAFREELELLSQHKQIHEGLDKFEIYLKEVKTAERDLSLGEMKKILDSFGAVLWSHLDDEVEQLSPGNMRKYWSVDEMQTLFL